MITIEPIPDPVFVVDMHNFKNQATMEDFHTMDMCVFNLETDPDKTFYDNDTDKEFYEKHSPGLWGKCECQNKEVDTINLLTPPTSPQHDPFSDIANTNDVLSDTINGVDDDTLTSAYIAAELFADLKFDPDTLNSNLVQDCMWSGPGLQAAGFGVNSLLGKKRTVDENCNTIVKKKKTSDIKTSDCVDPTVVFPNGLCSRNTSPTPSISSPDCETNDWIAGLETPSASESDEEEIDVVNVADKAKSSINKNSVPALNSSVKSRPTIKVVNSSGISTIVSTNLPATTSMSAQVAALHNYSSTTPSSKSHSCLKVTLSAPQTPSSNGLSSLTSSLKRSRPFSSSPSSPQSCKKQRLHNPGHRLIANEKDLQLVARKLSSGRKPKVSSYTDSHSYSRSSSDNEDLSESGKRAYHNVLERKRRDDLRLSFHMLRQVVPEIRDNERAPKMVILNTSTEHVLELTRESLALNVELQKQKHYNEQLKKKLALLRRDQY